MFSLAIADRKTFDNASAPKHYISKY